jgi:two-component system chemotaxis response regulator CheY
VALVMVVDDAQFMRMRLTKILTDNGYEVIEVADGANAVQVFEEKRPDLVLLDITMPGMDGLDVLKAIREKSSDAKVIMCTALGQQSVVINAIKAGAKDFIVKPFQPDTVIAAVSKQVSNG